VSDFSVRNIPGLGQLQAEIERTTTKLAGRLDSAGDYTPGDPDKWADPPPTSITDALDRLAKAIADGTSPA
jgi:hypothetical protein